MGKGRTTTGMIVACLVRDVVHGQVMLEHAFSLTLLKNHLNHSQRISATFAQFLAFSSLHFFTFVVESELVLNLN